MHGLLTAEQPAEKRGGSATPARAEHAQVEGEPLTIHMTEWPCLCSPTAADTTAVMQYSFAGAIQCISHQVQPTEMVQAITCRG